MKYQNGLCRSAAALLLCFGCATASAQDASAPPSENQSDLLNELIQIAPAEEAHPAAAEEAAAPSPLESQVSPTQAPAAETIAAPQPPPAASAVAPNKNEGRVEEIVVTANYRSQGVQDVVGTVQAFSGADLDKSGAAGMEDYLLQVPSISLQPSGNGKMNLAMRGISNINATDLGANSGSPTVGVYLNDVAIQGSGVFPDLRIFDLDHIEVLKGPQGTLYGEGSMGGAIKMVTNAPDPNNWVFRTDGMYSFTSHGDPNHELRAAANIPLMSDTLGARVVGTSRKEGGFVNYTSLNRKNANSDQSDSLRAILSYKPLDWLNVGYMFLYNSDDRAQFPVVDVGAQDQLTNSGQENQYAYTRFTIHSLTARADLGFADLTSVSARYLTYRDSVRRVPFVQTLLDQTSKTLGVPLPNLFANSPSRFLTDLKSFSEELRLVSKGDNTVDWIVGAFYRNRKQHFQLLESEDSIPDVSVLDTVLGLTGLSGFNLLSQLQENSSGSEQFRQYAMYGEATWNIIPDQLTLTGGLRFYNENFRFIDFTQYYGIQGALIGLSPQNINVANPSITTFLDTTLVSRGVLPKVSLGWHIAEDHMLYVTVSRGFRSGMANTGSGSGNGPPVVNPDSVLNKEIGYKGTWLDGSLITDLAAFHIDWKQLQGTLEGTAHFGPVPVAFPYVGNAGDARVIGVEQTTTWAPLPFLMLNLNLGYNYGTLTKGGPGSSAVPNSELPNTPRFNGSSTVALTLPLPHELIFDFSTTYSYVGSQYTTFHVASTSTTGQKQESDGVPIDAYGLLKASLGLSYGTFHVQAFGDNLLDRRAIIGISAPIPQYTIITPRVIGLRASYDF